MNSISKSSTLILVILMFSACASQKIVHKDNLSNHWTQVEGDWDITDNYIVGTSESDWIAILSDTKLPKEYILTFSVLPETGTMLFEVITGLDKEKYLGVMIYKIDGMVKIEDRSLFSSKNRKDLLISTTGHIGEMPQVKYAMRYDWMEWKIQRTGGSLYLWIDGEPIIAYIPAKKNSSILNKNGQFGFAAKAGTIRVKDINIYAPKKKSSLSPDGFEGKSRRPFRDLDFSVSHYSKCVFNETHLKRL